MPVDKDTLLREMESYFGDDEKRIRHAHSVTEFAENLLQSVDADRDIVIASAVLHDIGIPVAEKKYGNAGGKFQEIEGPPVARSILNRLGYASEIVNEVCQIIGHHHSPGIIDTLNFKVLYDADWLVNLRDEFNISDKTKLANIIDRVFLTESGRKLARQIYLN